LTDESLPSGVLKVAEECKRLSYELDGVIIDTEEGAGFDAVCLRTVKRVRAALAALASPPPQATGAPQWLPIESAPKDGTLILGAAGWVEQGWWDDDRGEWWPHNTHWTDAHGGCLYPTHWQPLPAAPTAASQVEPEDKQ
jgi:hypothetical protein